VAELSDEEWLAKDQADREAHRLAEWWDKTFAGQPGSTNLHDPADLERHLREDHGVEPTTDRSHWDQHYWLHHSQDGPRPDAPFVDWSTAHRHLTPQE
jgi:hypothetical protein